jgi:hypothetical protein
MRRRDLLGFVPVSAAHGIAGSPVAWGQVPQHHIAFVHSAIPATEGSLTYWIRRFIGELRALGYGEDARAHNPAISPRAL